MEGLFDMLGKEGLANQIPSWTGEQPSTGTGPNMPTQGLDSPFLASLLQQFGSNVSGSNGASPQDPTNPNANTGIGMLMQLFAQRPQSNIRSNTPLPGPSTNTAPSSSPKKLAYNDWISKVGQRMYLPMFGPAQDGDIVYSNTRPDLPGEAFRVNGHANGKVNAMQGVSENSQDGDWVYMGTGDPRNGTNNEGMAPVSEGKWAWRNKDEGNAAPEKPAMEEDNPQGKSVFPYITSPNGSDESEYRRQARLATEGMNRYPTVFADSGSLMGMNPVEVRDLFYPKDLQNVPKTAGEVGNSLYDMLIKQYGGTPRGKPSVPTPSR
jgi:hypothetical protein